MSATENEAEIPKALPWYKKIFYCRRYLQARQLAREFKEKYAEEEKSFPGLSYDLPLPARGELIAAIFELLQEAPFAQVREDLQNVFFSLHLSRALRTRQPEHRASSKGSIGHDRLNVETLSSGDWQSRTREVFAPTPSPVVRQFSSGAASYKD